MTLRRYFRHALLAGATGTAIVAAYLAIDEVLGDHAETQELLVRFGSGLEPGMTRSDVRNRFQRLGQPPLRLIESAPVWAVLTPNSFGARNWFVFVEFRGDTVRCVTFRSADNVRVRPRNAPRDRCGEP